MVIPISRLIFAPHFVLVFAALVMVALTACTSESSALGQYRKGRTLHFSVVSLERTGELRYSTCDVLVGSSPPECDPDGIQRRWSISPSAKGMELVLVRARVENHTAVSAIISVDRDAAELRDFANANFLPLAVNNVAWQDFRGPDEMVVRVDKGECFDGTRALIDVGSSLTWQSESDESQTIAFDDASVGVGSQGRAELAPGASVAHTFNQTGAYRYTCSGADGTERAGEVLVAAPSASSDYIDRTTRFLQGSFELPQGHGVDGFLVFEAPAGTQFRDIRWRAGDSILFGF